MVKVNYTYSVKAVYNGDEVDNLSVIFRKKEEIICRGETKNGIAECSSSKFNTTDVVNITITDQSYRYKMMTVNYTFEYNNGRRQYVPTLTEQEDYELRVDIQPPEGLRCPTLISGSVTYQGKILFSGSTDVCQFVFTNKEEESTKLQLG